MYLRASSFIALMSRIARFSVVVLIFGRGRHALRSMPRPSGTIGRAPSGCPDILCASVYRICKGRPPTRRALAGRSSMSDPHFYSLSGPLDSIPSERLMRTAHLSSEEHSYELQSLMRISYSVFFLNKKETHN